MAVSVGYYFDTKQRENNYGEVKRRSFLESKQPKKKENQREKGKKEKQLGNGFILGGEKHDGHII